MKINCKNLAFTLAEVLITLGIIGVVAAMTIPTLISKSQDMEYKTAYKKAYADFAQVFLNANINENLKSRTATFDSSATDSEWSLIQEKFKIVHDCSDSSTFFNCWVNADTVNDCPQNTQSAAFIDAAGRSWAQYYELENIYLVDTNGLKPPNRFGKDRWMFTLYNSSGRVISGTPTKVGIYTAGEPQDKSSASIWCNYPPCYYYSWLFN